MVKDSQPIYRQLLLTLCHRISLPIDATGGDSLLETACLPNEDNTL